LIKNLKKFEEEKQSAQQKLQSVTDENEELLKNIKNFEKKFEEEKRSSQQKLQSATMENEELLQNVKRLETEIEQSVTQITMMTQKEEMMISDNTKFQKDIENLEQKLQETQITKKLKFKK